MTSTVREATEADLESIAEVAAAAGQFDEWGGGNPDYVRHLMDLGRVVVAERGGSVLGFGATEQVGAVSMLCDLFVDPAAHGTGLGRAMLTELWGAADHRMTFSSLHAHAIPLYTGFGLDAWWPLLYLRGDTGSLPIGSGCVVEPTTAAAVAGHELAWTGADRSADYQAWAARPGGECLVIARQAEVIAAGSVNHGADRGIVHLAVSPGLDDRTAATIVLAALAELAGRTGQPARVCLPAPHPAVRELLAAGWRFDEFDLFMASAPDLLDARRAVPSPAQA